MPRRFATTWSASRVRASRLTKAARADFADAVRYYRQVDPDVAVRFAEAVRGAIRFAVAHPATPPIKYGYHSWPVDGSFPFSIWYRVEAGVVVVAAIWAQRRDPAKLLSRLGQS